MTARKEFYMNNAKGTLTVMQRGHNLNKHMVIWNEILSLKRFLRCNRLALTSITEGKT